MVQGCWFDYIGHTVKKLGECECTQVACSSLDAILCASMLWAQRACTAVRNLLALAIQTKHFSVLGASQSCLVAPTLPGLVW